MMPGKVLIKPVGKEEEVSDSGIIISASENDNPRGTVICIGPKPQDFDCLPIHEGDEVVYIKGQGIQVTYNGKDYIATELSSILIVIPSERKI